MATIDVLANWEVSTEERSVIESSWPPEARITFGRPEVLEPGRTVLAELDVAVGHLNETLLECAPNLKLVHVLGHGVDFLLAKGLREKLLARNIAVAKANAGAITIAEFAISCMIALSRRIFKFHEALAYQGRQNVEIRAARMQGSIGGELYRSTLGIVGFGSIGKELSLLARAFGMTIGALSRHPESINKDLYGIQFTASLNEIDEFLGRCDYVVLCLPNTPVTRDLMDHRRFAAMKKGAYLVNVGRGTLVVEEALWEALKSERLAGAALDVNRNTQFRSFGGYPFPFPVHQYNVILTPHYAGSTYEARVRALQTVGENLRRLAQGAPLINLADLHEGF